MTPSPLRAVCLALSVACLPAVPAMAAGSLYADMAGIAGGSAAPQRSGQIDLGALSWGASRSVYIEDGRRVIGALHVQEIAWSQALDASTDDLFSRATTGAQVRSARFELVDARSTGQAPLLILDAGESRVNALTLGGGSGGIDVNASLNASHVSLQYDPRPIKGPGTVTDVAYDARLGESTGSLTRAPLQPIGVAPARAGLYLRLGTGDSVIAGDNPSLGHENWIAIDAFSTGASGVGAPGRPLSVQDMSWTQRLDATSPVVLANLLAGKAIGQATLEQVAIDAAGRPMTMLQQALNDVVFTSFSLGVDANGDASVNTTMAFTSYTQTNWLLLNDGQRIGPLSVGYDVLKGQRMTAALASDVVGFGLGRLDGTEVVSPPPIPEPQTWALLLAGLAGVLVMARRQGASRA